MHAVSPSPYAAKNADDRSPTGWRCRSGGARSPQLSRVPRRELHARAHSYVAVSRRGAGQDVLMAADGLDNDEIASLTRREIVSEWRQRFFERCARHLRGLRAEDSRRSRPAGWTCLQSPPGRFWPPRCCVTTGATALHLVLSEPPDGSVRRRIRDDLGGPLSWDIAFLILGAILILTRLAVTRWGAAVAVQRIDGSGPVEQARLK